MRSDTETIPGRDSPTEASMYRYWIAFAAMGFLVGNIAGLSSAAVTQPLLAAVLAFGGGSIIAFQSKLNKERYLPGALHAVAAFSLATLLGMYFALYLTAQYPSLLSPPPSEASLSRQNKPLRSGHLNTVQDVLEQVSKGAMTPSEALEVFNQVTEQ